LIEKKRKEEQATEEKERQQEKEAMGKGLRREIWIHPDNSSKEWLTPADDKSTDWREEELAKMSFTELNRQFLTSYLHVQGKLFTKIG
jgi:protein SMG6